MKTHFEIAAPKSELPYTACGLQVHTVNRGLRNREPIPTTKETGQVTCGRCTRWLMGGSTK